MGATKTIITLNHSLAAFVAQCSSKDSPIGADRRQEGASENCVANLITPSTPPEEEVVVLAVYRTGENIIKRNTDANKIFHKQRIAVRRPGELSNVADAAKK